MLGQATYPFQPPLISYDPNGSCPVIPSYTLYTLGRQRFLCLEALLVIIGEALLVITWEALLVIIGVALLVIIGEALGFMIGVALVL